MVSATAGINGTDTYGYGPDSKRVYKMHPNGNEEYYFWLGSKKLGVYTLGTNGSGNLAVQSGGGALWFGNRKVQTQDRIGSTTNSYYPYGEDRGTAPPSDADKFATYYRDLTTGLDYADHRYYSSSLGRFLTPDPKTSSARLGDPTSFNRYSYVGDDPINWIDPTGLDDADCNKYLTKINQRVFGNDTTLKPTKGLIQRFDQQIYGKLPPGTNSWAGHNEAIQTLQQGLKALMSKFIDDKCPPPGNWKVFDYWANKALPDKEDYKGPKEAPTINQYYLDTVPIFIFQLMQQTLELIEDWWPEIEPALTARVTDKITYFGDGDWVVPDDGGDVQDLDHLLDN
jgi:RHS repeat-associated protein